MIDLYSRFIVGWQISNTLEKENQTELLRDCIRQYGKPEIINSNQGSQYTCKHWVDTLASLKIRISMDGKGNGQCLYRALVPYPEAKARVFASCLRRHQSLSRYRRICKKI